MVRSLIGLVLFAGLLTTVTACGSGGSQPTDKSEEQSQQESDVREVDAKSDDKDDDDGQKPKGNVSDQDRDDKD